MIALDLSRTGTTATTPRKDKPAGVGDAGFGVQMQKALAAGPSDRSGNANRPHASATPSVDRAHAEDTRKRASGDVRSTARHAARNSGMEGAGPEPGASVPSVQAPGTPGAAQAETVPAGGTTVATPAGTVDDLTPAQAPALEGAPTAGAVTAEALAAAAAELSGSEGHPVVSSPAPQLSSMASAGVATTAAAAAAPDYRAASAVTAGTTGASDSATVAAAADIVLEAPSAGLDGKRPATVGTPATVETAATAGMAGATGTAATAVPADAGGVQANQAQSAVVPIPGASAAPAHAPVVTAGPAPAATQAAAPAYPPLTGQLTGPLLSLASARAGEHTMTLSVTPENLGPVTVRAHIGTEGVRVELFAPNDAGREALRAILQDLKRDLASAGLGSNLDLSARDSPDGAKDHAGERGERSADGPRRFRVPSGEAAVPHMHNTHLRYAGTTGLDVLA